MRRRRPGRRLATASIVAAIALAVPSSGGTGAVAAAARGPDVHVGGIGLDAPAGPPRAVPVPWLSRPGSSDRPAHTPGGTAGRRRLAPSIVAPGVFDGVPNLDPPLASPGDPTGALGIENHVAAVNVHMASYDRAGVPHYAPKRLRSLDPQLPSGADDFDPKVVYDPYGDVFMVAFMSATAQRSFMSIVVIPEGREDSSARTDWCTLHLSGDQVAGNGKQLADYPMLGFTSNRVTLTTNQFDFDSLAFRYVQIVSIRKADLYDCEVDPVPIKVFSRKQTRDPDGSRAFTIVPAISAGGDPRVQYMASMDFNGTKGKLILWRLKIVKGKLKLARSQVASGSAKFPPFGLQCGGRVANANTWWDTGDVRLTSAFWDGNLGHLYTATAVKGNRGGGEIESVVKWWEVDPAGSLANSDVVRQGTVGTPNRDSAWPSIATDGDGNVWINYARAGVIGPDECLSAYAGMVAPGSTAATSILIRAGEARYEYADGDPERWGDYTALTRDPVDPTIMAAYGAYALDDGDGNTDTWQQTIATLEDA